MILKFSCDDEPVHLAFMLGRLMMAGGDDYLIVGATFRTSRMFLVRLHTIVGGELKLDVDCSTLTYNGQVLRAVGLGDGSKIRGLRPKNIIFVRYDIMPKYIVEEVICSCVMH
jgi:hypothetical protein